MIDNIYVLTETQTSSLIVQFQKKIFSIDINTNLYALKSQICSTDLCGKIKNTWNKQKYYDFKAHCDIRPTVFKQNKTYTRLHLITNLAEYYFTVAREKKKTPPAQM